MPEAKRRRRGQGDEDVRTILMGLRFSSAETNDLTEQVIAELRPGNVMAVMGALMILADHWPDAKAKFRAFVMAMPDRWVAEVKRMPLVERFLAYDATSRALGIPDTPELQEAKRGLAALAAAELVRRGVPSPATGVQ
ncbi:hypothetical protein X739_01320 [Mesorhizobium sp. LNHC220B00]|nr:hypothetical protein [Mesorhizobium sp. LNHC220B00]ESY89077.1 hypothetical protein X739_01320 [Mesorhizobium sp. LNHC220B00]